MNKLALETSPYLLQHANNPIFWQAWNDESLALAVEKNLLIVISVGYSACHWCHVMEHESFDDLAVAKTMNSGFVAIKVDREERPDVDAVYMKAIQIMNNSGGWPMNVVCLPDGRPVWGGTYFRKNDWINSLEQLKNLYAENPAKMREYAEKLQQGIKSIGIVRNDSPAADLSQDLIKPLIEKWKRSFDWEYGGMARAPKFMMPNNYSFLLRYAHQNGDGELLDFVNLTLTRMAFGGLFDTVDGGFSRYSVDMKWHVPHFEKMLYDNAQLVSVYADAYKLSGNTLYKTVIEKTLQFIEKEWFTGFNGFFSALDADSINQENHLEEGAFYVWNKQELQQIIGQDFELFSQIYNINEFGFWENDNYVLIQNDSLENIAVANKIPIQELEIKKYGWEKLLYSEREKRNKPRLDDKCLTSWNALMITGFVDAYKALETEKYLETALQNAHFLIDNVWLVDGNLYHNFKDNKPTINGYLEDYCFVIQAFIDLYQVTFDDKWLRDSKKLTDYCIENFYDIDSGFFEFKSKLDKALIAAHFEIEDNVISASNSVMAHNLYQLSIYFDNQNYETICKKMLHHVVPNIDYPSVYANWLNVFMSLDSSNKELTICGLNAVANAKKLNKKYLPNVLLAGTISESNIPFLKNRFQENQNLYYICENKTCGLPVTDFEKMIGLLG